MPVLHFITHPEVVIDPSVPVPDWKLSSKGIKRMMVAVQQPWTHELSSVFSSAERKAIEAARIVRDKFGLSPIVIAELGENDRSATGYLPKAEFEATADLFFARPEESVRGWERAADAQRRILAAVERVITDARGGGDIAVIAHGGVWSAAALPPQGIADQPDRGPARCKRRMRVLIRYRNEGAAFRLASDRRLADASEKSAHRPPAWHLDPAVCAVMNPV